MITNNLKTLREEKGLTQKQLCAELNSTDCYLTRSAYAKYEIGIRNVPCDILIKLAKFHGTTCDYILGIM